MRLDAELSPGLAYSCFDLLDLINRNPCQLSHIRHIYPKIGVCPVKLVVDSAIELGWVIADDDGLAVLSRKGSSLLSLPTNPIRLRRAILDYLDTVKPPWLQNARFGRQKVLAYASAEVRQCFWEAGLTDTTDDPVIDFWDMLSARARGQSDDVLMRIGRSGERLSLAYETARTGSRPKWIAIESNDVGYDILSRVSVEDSSTILIEVKATTQGMNGEFHLTRNEWERSISSSHHVFHLWCIDQSVPALAVIGASDMEPHIPRDQGRGAWELTAIRFDVFHDDFRPCPHE